MKRLPPSGYVSYAETMKSGYLEKRMKEYRRKVEEQARKQRENEAEALAKTIKLKVKQ